MDREDGVYERLSKNKSRLLLCFNEICFLNIIVMGGFSLLFLSFFGIFFCVGGMQNLDRFFVQNHRNLSRLQGFFLV